MIVLAAWGAAFILLSAILYRSSRADHDLSVHLQKVEQLLINLQNARDMDAAWMEKHISALAKEEDG